MTNCVRNSEELGSCFDRDVQSAAWYADLPWTLKCSLMPIGHICPASAGSASF